MENHNLEDYLDNYLTKEKQIELAKEVKAIFETSNVLDTLNSIVETINSKKVLLIGKYTDNLPIGLCFAYNTLIILKLLELNYINHKTSCFIQGDIYDYLKDYLENSGLYKYATKPDSAFKFNNKEERISALTNFIQDLENDK